MLSLNGVEYDFSTDEYEDYKTTLKDLMKEMEIGKLYPDKDERNIYFKLMVGHNKRRGFYWLFDDLKKWGRVVEEFQKNFNI